MNKIQARGFVVFVPNDGWEKLKRSLLHLLAGPDAASRVHPWVSGLTKGDFARPRARRRCVRRDGGQPSAGALILLRLAFVIARTGYGSKWNTRTTTRQRQTPTQTAHDRSFAPPAQDGLKPVLTDPLACSRRSPVAQAVGRWRPATRSEREWPTKKDPRDGLARRRQTRWWMYPTQTPLGRRAHLGAVDARSPADPRLSGVDPP